MTTKITLSAQNKKIVIGYSIFVFIIVPITAGTSRIVLLILRERIFISKSFQKKLNKKLKQINLKKNLKDFFDILTIFYTFYIFLEIIFPKNVFFLKLIRYIFSQLGLFFYFKFGFILQILIKNVEFINRSSLGIFLTNFVLQLNYDLRTIIQYFRKLIKKVFSKSDLMDILSALFQSLCNGVIILSGILIWSSIFFEFLLSTGSISIFFKEISSIFTGLSLKNIIVLPSRVINALKIVMVSVAIKQKKEFLSCDTKLKKVVYLSSRAMFYVVWLCYIRKTLKTYYSFC